MTKHTLAVSLIIFAVAFSWPRDVVAQKRQSAPVAIEEVKYKGVAAIAPKACLLAFREFFRYLQRSDATIVRDDAAQKRWLTQELRSALAQKVSTFTSPADDPDFPSNSTFVGSWNYSSTFAIAASRRYGQRAVIDVVYKWGPRTDYPGDERTSSFIFLYEDGAWKLEDIYTFRGAFVQAESLSQYLRGK